MKERGKKLLQLALPAVACTALWGSAAPCVKTGYALLGIESGDVFSQLVFAGVRFGLAGVIVLLVTAVTRRRVLPRKSDLRGIICIGLFQNVIQNIFYYGGAALTTGTKTSLLSGTQTFFALLLAHIALKDDKLNLRKSLACAAGFAGIITLGSGRGGMGGFSVPGDIFVLLSAVSAGAGTLAMRAFTPGRDAMILTGWQLFSGGAILAVSGLAGGGTLGTVTAGGALLLSYMVVLSAAAVTVWTALLGRFSVGQVGLFGFLIPVFGAFFSAIVLKEKVFTVQNMAALVLVSGGIAIANISPRAGGKNPPLS